MHTGHRFLPYFSRLDDGLVVERKHPAGETLAAGSAQARGTHQDPLLLDLASHALDLPAGGAVMAAATGATTTVDPPSSGVMAMIGLRCPPDTVAVAATTQCETLWPDGGRRSGLLAWSLDRNHNSSALFREQPGHGVEMLDAVAGTLLDAGLRALGPGHTAVPLPFGVVPGRRVPAPVVEAARPARWDVHPAPAELGQPLAALPAQRLGRAADAQHDAPSEAGLPRAQHMVVSAPQGRRSTCCCCAGDPPRPHPGHR